jgi:hypothetical protein
MTSMALSRFPRVFFGSFACLSLAFAMACSAGSKGFPGDDGSGAAGSAGEGAGTGGVTGISGAGGVSGSGDPNPLGGSGGDGGSGITFGGSGGTGGTTPQNACASPCGPVELCDLDHLGYDDNCNGQVDEGCPCTAGQTHWCFKGDPSFRTTGACKDGVERCSELGEFGACQGGKHATAEENCQVAVEDGCKDINAAPFSIVNLATGTTGFATDADTGSGTYAVQCPPGVSPCPGVNGSGASASFQPLQSGQYVVTYTKTVGGAPSSCKYSVYVGAGGLRIELGWDSAGKEAPSAGSTLKGPDLDLHVHRPGTTTPWGTSDDCNYTNCRADNFDPSSGATPGPQWFSDMPMGDAPHNWTKRPSYKDNLCYSAPKGGGGVWAVLDKGCHNPRLDLDNFGCDVKSTNPADADFCSPENVNFDEVPTGSWLRVGVEYHGTCAPTLPTHPVVRVYCAGGQVAELGSSNAAGTLASAGYDAPVTFNKADCGATFWLAADVFVTQNECSIQCVVKPIYATTTEKKPLFLSVEQSRKSFGPAYPPNP